MWIFSYKIKMFHSYSVKNLVLSCVIKKQNKIKLNVFKPLSLLRFVDKVLCPLFFKHINYFKLF